MCMTDIKPVSVTFGYMWVECVCMLDTCICLLVCLHLAIVCQSGLLSVNVSYGVLVGILVFSAADWILTLFRLIYLWFITRFYNFVLIFVNRNSFRYWCCCWRFFYHIQTQNERCSSVFCAKYWRNFKTAEILYAEIRNGAMRSVAFSPKMVIIINPVGIYQLEVWWIIWILERCKFRSFS